MRTAVILARGLGTRMRAEGGSGLSEAQAKAAASGHKALMPIGEHCLIDYSLSRFVDAGFERVVLVVPPDHEAFKEHFADAKPSRLAIEFAVQEEPLGTANALASAREVVGDEPFLMANGDNLYPLEAIAELKRLGGTAIAGFDKAALVRHSNIPEDRISAFALVKAVDGRFDSMVEKPTAEQIAQLGPEAPVSMNLFAFTPEIFDACDKVEPSARGEYEIVDAVALIDDVRVIPVSGGVLDLSRRDDIESVEQLLASVEVAL